ncbi:MAG: lysine N(6)-hydroxylase/L-ornithine N(5)-oxygenase family protein [Solirubrobacteraceae bacterium MAG38_C4-C5]|nr:lysine N(6)-hydroxylase/L-ornithine N(5)-oxygenase family protein [Candidatus Siliceabacter maunaloa]
MAPVIPRKAPAECVHDVLGIGFGPSNLALAIAIDEHNRSRPGDAALDAVFIEKQSRFGWHRGMLIDDATMQVSFLKDLVTMRDPTSAHSFVAYLHDRGRLVDFMNHKTLFPLRIEFHDYLEWSAGRMSHLVEYGGEVVDVQPVREDEVVWAFDVTVREPGREPIVRRARNLVVAIGLELRMPPGIERSARIWHSRDFLRHVEELADGPRPGRFVVIGAGQSAAEVTGYLHREFPEAEVCAVFSRYGYSPADDSPFANRIFDPEAVDLYYDAPPAAKRMLLDYHRNTNYSVVDTELIEELYRRSYQEKVTGRERLRILHTCKVLGVRHGDGAVLTTLESLATGERSELESDAVIFATGYRPVCPLGVLGQARSLCATGDGGMVCIRRDYRIATTCATRAAIYLQGATEHTHGIGSTLLSNTAVRAGEILDSVLRHDPQRSDGSLVYAGEQA